MIRPTYGAIEPVRDICEPWVEIWSGDEWGESMEGLLAASHTSYGLDDADCALIAAILLRNVIAQHEWMEEEGHSYGLSMPDDEEQARKEATESRDYWLKGGNLGSFHTTIEDAKSSIAQMPDWMFNE